jgi:hypothetical protein
MTILIIALIVITAAATFVFFYTSTYHKRRAKMLEKVPVSPVGDIEEKGVAKVVGKVVALEKTVASPIAKAKCVYYRLCIEKQKAEEESASAGNRRRVTDEDDDGGEWETVVEDVKAIPFAVEDDTGMAAVETKNLDVEVKSGKRKDSGYLKGLSSAQEKLLTERYPGKKFSFSKRMRYTEVVIEEGDELMVTGEVDLPKGDNPRFVGLDDQPVVVSDRTENKAAAESLSKAKSGLIFTGISGVCTVGLIVWLVIHLASPKKSSSSGGSESASNTTNSSTNSGKNEPKNVNANGGGDNIVNPGPKFENPPDRKFENPPENPPPPPPPNNDPDAGLPKGNDLKSVLVRYKAKADRNDVFGVKRELDILHRHFKPNLPQQAEVHGVLMGYANVENPFIRGDSWREALFWTAPADAPALAKLLAAETDDGRKGELIRRLGELKNPAAAGTLAEFLNEDRWRGDATNALKALGAGAEAAVLAKLKTEKDPQAAIHAIQVLEEVGGKDSAAALDALVADPDRNVSDHAKRALEKVGKRSGYVRNINNLLVTFSAKLAANDHFAAKDALKEIGAAYKPDHPKRGEVFAVLFEAAGSTKDVFVRGDAAREACRWAVKDDVPRLAELLTTCKDGGIESAILAKLKEFKDPRCAEAVASFLIGFKKEEAKAVLIALGPEAEEAVQPYTRATTPDGGMNPFFNRTPAIDILAAIGTKKSIPLLMPMTKEFGPVKDASTKAIKAIQARKS